MERRDLVVDQVIEEYQAYCAGRLWMQFGTRDAPGGDVEYCGIVDDLAHWTVCYVRAADDAVLPLAVGDQPRVFAEVDAMDLWHEERLAPTVALIGGSTYPFKAARGRHLLGVVRLERQAVLLAAVGDRLVAVHHGEGATSVFPLGRPGGVREVDVDMLLASSRRRVAASSKGPGDPLRPSAGTRAQHLRIAAGRPVDLGGGPTLGAVLRAAFDDIEARATTPSSPLPPKRAAAPGKTAVPKRPKLKGKKWVPLVLAYLRKMALLGCGDLVGLSGTIIAAIQARFPNFIITGEAFADAMKLIVATGTCLVAPRAPGGDRIWWIKLEGLTDPTSPQHRRLCRETRSRSRVEEPAAANQQPEQAAAPAGQDSGTAADANAASSDARAPEEGRFPLRNASTADADEHAAPGDAIDEADAGPGERSDAASGAGALSAASAASAQAEALRLVGQLGMLWCCLQMVEAERCGAAGKDASHVAGNAANAPSAAISDSDGRATAEVVSRVQQLAMIPRVGPMLLRGYLLRIEAERGAAVGKDTAHVASPPTAARPCMDAVGDGAAHVAAVSPRVAEITDVSPRGAEIVDVSPRVPEIGTSPRAAEIAPASPRPDESAATSPRAAEIAAVQVQADERAPRGGHKHDDEMIRLDGVDLPVVPSIVSSLDAVGVVACIVAWSRLWGRWTAPGPRRITPRAPLRDAARLPRHPAFAPVQPEPRCRGTLGPRGPPYLAERLTQPSDARRVADRRGRRWAVTLRRRAAGRRVPIMTMESRRRIRDRLARGRDRRHSEGHAVGHRTVVKRPRRRSLRVGGGLSSPTPASSAILILTGDRSTAEEPSRRCLAAPIRCMHDDRCRGDAGMGLRARGGVICRIHGCQALMPSATRTRSTSARTARSSRANVAAGAGRS